MLAVQHQLDAIEIGVGGIPPAHDHGDAGRGASREADTHLPRRSGCDDIQGARSLPAIATGDGAAAVAVSTAAAARVATTTVRPGLTAVVESSLTAME